MGWRITNVEEQRKEFIDRYLDKEGNLTELCEFFGISRKSAYKWIERFENSGYEGLKDKSRARHAQLKTTDELVEKVLTLKRVRTTWGPKKILGFLECHQPDYEWPSSTTIGNILLKNGFQKVRQARKRLPARTEPFSECRAPNDIWSIDFKGGFKTKEGIKCDPLTISDAYSRFLLHCSKLPLGTAEYVWDTLEKNFYKYGLPNCVRHDNGPPFATCGAGRLSKLSINLIKAGVTPEWIDPGKPYQNGRHERMHRTLKAEGIAPFKLTLKEHELKFNEFQNYFNFERPHESLGQKTPGSVYTTSPREWNGRLKSPEYDSQWKVIKVSAGGQIRCLGKDVFISKNLRDEHLGLCENEDGDWVVNYGPVQLGVISHDGKLVYPIRQTRVIRSYREKIF